MTDFAIIAKELTSKSLICSISVYLVIVQVRNSTVNKLKNNEVIITTIINLAKILFLPIYMLQNHNAKRSLKGLSHG